jgi:UDP-N-acetylmuramoyl-tripeptide--D-alanyl-D-alanine ligase
MAFEDISLLLVLFGYLGFTARRLMTFAQGFQQEEYDGPRFVRWILKNKVFDRRLSLAMLGCGMINIFAPELLSNALTLMCFTAIAIIEKDPLKRGKKKLVLTARVKRILSVAIALALLAGLAMILVPSPLIWILGAQIVPLWLVMANSILQPYEDSLQKKLWNEAHNKLSGLNPKVIGITGSFGKTSVKHILGHILKLHGPTLITPGSVNTPMGITRIIREDLNDTHQFFVVEMGAYGPGSIARLCRLTPPDMAIITAIGHAHYERFKTLEAVAETKFELAQAALAKSGKVIAHERTLRFEHSRAIRNHHAAQFIICGEPRVNDVSYLQARDVHLVRAVQKPEGIETTLRWADMEYNFVLPLFGIHHTHNAMLSFAAALTLGLPADSVITALESVPQIAHRLELKRLAGGAILIDDAYNSNPVGFRCALDLMESLSPTGRKILVTPGMVEMGAAHDEAHHSIGVYAGKTCDVVLLVAADRIPTFIKGFEETGKGASLIQVASFAEAQNWLEAYKQDGDVILLENDLPDIYESIPKL